MTRYADAAVTAGYVVMSSLQKHNSTIDAISDLIHSVVDGLKKKEHLLSILFHLSKDLGCYATLLHLLWTSDIRGSPHDWLSSYLKAKSMRPYCKCVVMQSENSLRKWIMGYLRYLSNVMVDNALSAEFESTKFLVYTLIMEDYHIESVCSKVASGIYVLCNLVTFGHVCAKNGLAETSKNETRSRDNFRNEQHRTYPKQFKSRLKHLLVSKTFYSVEEFMIGRWR
ncbi:hypothetical protein J6590_032150 [Homalodisca vitripennis]|nr:hypothetical protein J6590_032150 [Homalodisca vitripennis]